MKNKVFLLLILILISCKVKPKLDNVNINKTKFELNKIKISDIEKIEIENKGIEIFKSYNISLSKEYFPEIENYKFDQPKIYVRDTLNMETTVSYFFTKKDSVVRLIEYSWNQNRKKKLFIDNLYKFNKINISKKIHQNGNEISQKIDGYWQKEIKWDNDSIHIFSFIFGIEKGQRTRVIVRYK